MQNRTQTLPTMYEIIKERLEYLIKDYNEQIEYAESQGVNTGWLYRLNVRQRDRRTKQLEKLQELPETYKANLTEKDWYAIMFG